MIEIEISSSNEASFKAQPIASPITLPYWLDFMIFTENCWRYPFQSSSIAMSQLNENIQIIISYRKYLIC